MIFFFDRNLGKRVPREMQASGVNVERHDDHFVQKTPDDVWMSQVSQNDWVVITGEKLGRGTQKSVIFKRDIKKYVLKCFAIYGQSLGAEAKIATLKAVWPRIERLSRIRSAPFLYRVAVDGTVDRLALPD